MSAPRLVYASFDRFPAPKGAAVHIRAFVEALGTAFGGVDLVAIDSGEPASLPPGVHYHPLRAHGPDLIAQALDFRAQLAAWWRERPRASVVHVRSPFEGYPVARHKARLAERLVLEVNGLPSIELKYHYPRAAEDAELVHKLRAQEARCLEAADLVLTPSTVTAEHLQARGVPAGRLCVIPNGVDTDVFAWRAPRPRDAGTFRLLYSGTVSAWQGVQHALEALRLLRREVPATLTLAGPVRRHQRKELLARCGELLAEGAVELLGPLPQPELARLHHACDAVLVPLSANDRNLVQGCCPLKLLEALASGTPVVSTDLPVVRAVVDPGVHALLVRPGSARALADALLTLWREPHLGLRLSRQARTRIERDFTWAKAQEALVALYAERLGVAPASTRRSDAASLSA